ncbi:MAG: hypothetical protein IKM39_04375 [Clostridia bacterium]|nr:hypothetical protein [Clostridia bacterium]
MHIEIPMPPQGADLQEYLRQLVQVLQQFADVTHRELTQLQLQQEGTALGK